MALLILRSVIFMSSIKPVNGLHNVNHLLLVLHGPVDLVVVTSTQINHDVLVPERHIIITDNEQFESNLKKNMMVQGS